MSQNAEQKSKDMENMRENEKTKTITQEVKIQLTRGLEREQRK